MVFEVDPDKPDIPALARILSGMGILCLIGTAASGMLAFSAYPWVNENYAMAGAGGGFLLALIFIGQAKTLELLAVVSARVKSRFAIDNFAKTMAVPTSASMSAAPVVTTGSAMPPLAPKPGMITQPVKERIIHVPDEQARQQGFKVR